MIKIDFDTYSYFGDKNNNYTNNEQYAFSERYFNELIDNRRYEEAADYASKYRFNDPNLQQKHENDINNLRTNGKIVSSVYSKVTDPEKLAKLKFADAVFNNHGIERLLSSTDANDDMAKEYARTFMKYKKQLGSKGEDEATHLAFTFAPKQRSLLGIDWLAVDNNNTIDNFYQNSGFTEAQLLNAGIEVIKKDGYATIRFGKDNQYANKLIYELGKNFNSTGYNTPLALTGYKKEGANFTKLDSFQGNLMPDPGNPLAAINSVIYNLDSQLTQSMAPLTNVGRSIEDAINTRKEAFENAKTGPKLYSSTVGGPLSDDLEALNDAYKSGDIDNATYNREYKKISGNLDVILQGIGSGNYKFYSNVYNNEPTDETLVEASNPQRGEIMNLISGVDRKRLHLLSMVNNGEIGTLIVIDGAQDAKEEKDDVNSGYKSKRRMVFVPGLFQELAQQKINRNSLTKAHKEYNDMQRWGYDYDLVDGEKLSVDPSGAIVYGDRVLDKDEAIREINKDIIKRNYGDNLKYNYLNSKGQLINQDDYIKKAQYIAVKAANELRPDVPLNKIDGTPYTIDEIFGYKANPTDEELLNQKGIDELQFQQYEKVSDILEIYNYILQGTSYYKY